MKDFFHLTHTDLDGIGCLFSTFAEFGKVSFGSISYDLIDDEIPNLDSNVITLITDLNFNERQLNILLDKAKEFAEKRIPIIYIDHHEYSEKELELLSELENMSSGNKVIVDTKYCASYLTAQYFEKLLIPRLGDDFKNFKETINIIDTYDVWRTERELFPKAFMLDKIFWMELSSKGQLGIINDFIDNKWKIPERYKTLEGSFLDQKSKDYEILKPLIFDQDGVFAIPSIKYIGDVRFDFPDRKIYIGFSLDKSKISVRVDEKYTTFKQAIIDDIINMPEVLASGGHNFAFGITLNDVKFVEKVVTRVIEKSLELTRGN